MKRETLLEKYIQEKLTETERQEFDTLVKRDANFQVEVEFHSNLKKVTEAQDDDMFREMLSDFESEARMEKTTTKRFPTKWLVAASIALIAGLAYFFTVDRATSTHDLFVQNFGPYRNVVHPIVRGEDNEDQKTQAFSAYQMGDYEKTLPLFTELYTDTEEPYYLFYKANALIQLNRAREAVPLLQEHLKTDDNLAKNSSWYLAMAYLQLGDKENAKKMLHSVVENGGYKTEDAQKLLEDLE